MSNKDNRWESFRIFSSALPLFLLWLALPVAILVGSSLYQSNQQLQSRRDATRREVTYQFTGPNSENLSLHVSSPSQLRINPAVPQDSSLVVWLTGPTDANSPQEPTPGYIFSFEPLNDSLDLTDKDGIPVPGIVTLLPTNDSQGAQTIYLKAVPAVAQEYKESIRISSALAVQGEAPVIEIPVEAAWRSRTRPFFNLLCGFPTLVGGLLTAIAGFGLQQWKVISDDRQKKREEEQKKKQKDEDELYQKLNAAFDAANYPLAFNLYEQSSKTMPGSSRLIEMFHDRVILAIEKEVASSPVDQVITLYNLISKAKLDSLRLTWDDVVTRRFGNLIISPNIESASRLYTLLEKYSLVNSKIQEAWDNRGSYYAGQGVAIFQLRHLLKSCPQIIIYETNLRRQERIEIKKAMALLNIKINPFGAEKAEEDLLFTSTENVFMKRSEKEQKEKDRKDPAAISRRDFLHTAASSAFPVNFDDILDRSQVIIGAHGSGKTALAMSLARKAFTLDKKAFPLYCQIFSGEDMRMILRKLVRSLLAYYINNPYEFFDLDPVRRLSFGVLLSKYFADGSDLASRLRLAGISDEPLCKKLCEYLVVDNTSARSIELTLEESGYLLLQSCPVQYEQVWFLFDNQCLSEHNQVGKDAIDLMGYLQLYGGVVKIFACPFAISTDFQERLKWDTIKLEWRADNLKDVLKVRIAHSDLGGVGRLFDNSVRSFAQDLFVKADNITPRDIIRKGNEILLRYEKLKQPLNVKDARNIFGGLWVRKITQDSKLS